MSLPLRQLKLSKLKEKWEGPSLVTSFRVLSARALAASALSFFFFVAARPALAQQTPTATPSATPQNVLAKVEFVGLKRVPQEEALSTAALQLGQAVDVDAVEQAATRLFDSGLFSKLSYNVRTSKGQVTVVFNVEEMASGRAPVVYDNFVWFSDKDLNEIVRKNVPGFDGTAPGAGAVTDNIARVLTELLRLKGVEGKVEYMPSADPSGRNPEHVFTVKGAGLRVCALKFTGTAAVKEETLVQNSAGIFANEYSRQYARAFAQETLTPLYRARGHLRAVFRAPSAKPTDAADSCSGVNVTVPVDEGIAYVWEGAEWTGNESLTAQELDAALGMTKRQLANGLKIDSGVEAAKKLYSRKGYLTARVDASPQFDDTARSVTYRLNVNEGPQYRMGEVIITGLSEKDTNNLKTRWQLQPRDVYDAEYIKQFIKQAVGEFMRDPSTDARASGQKFKLETSEKRDREKLTVDVTIDFKPQK